MLGFFVVVGWRYIERRATGSRSRRTAGPGVQAGAAIVFFAYIGFDAVSTVAEETRNPAARPADRHHRLARSSARSSTSSSPRCSPGIIPYDVLVTKLATEQAEPLTMALQYAHIEQLGRPVVGIVAFGSVVAHTAVLLVFQLGQPRIFFSMARDGLLPPSFAQRAPALPDAARDDDPDRRRRRRLRDVHEHRRDGGPDEHRHAVRVRPRVPRHPHPAEARSRTPRAFRTPLVPVVPVLGILSCVYLMLGLPWITWVRFALWLLVGLVIYFAYGIREADCARRRPTKTGHCVRQSTPLLEWPAPPTFMQPAARADS